MTRPSRPLLSNWPPVRAFSMMARTQNGAFNTGRMYDCTCRLSPRSPRRLAEWKESMYAMSSAIAIEQSANRRKQTRTRTENWKTLNHGRRGRCADNTADGNGVLASLTPRSHKTYIVFSELRPCHRDANGVRRSSEAGSEHWRVRQPGPRHTPARFRPASRDRRLHGRLRHRPRERLGTLWRRRATHD
jgi:hypothetical protein